MLCECGCGNTTSVFKITDPRYGQKAGEYARFLPGHNSRGSTNPRYKHGLYHVKSAEYGAYVNARGRCNNPNIRSYNDYGGRGIKFLYENFEQFLADLGLRPSPKHTLERLDNNGHYMPGNCCWTTRSEQCRNRRKYCALQNYTNAELLAECKRRNLIG